MEKIARYMQDEMKAKRLALIWVNNDFGKGGRTALSNMLSTRLSSMSAFGLAGIVSCPAHVCF
jgi:branched-chain amino acid transport system substrate-binding protein